MQYPNFAKSCWVAVALGAACSVPVSVSAQTVQPVGAGSAPTSVVSATQAGVGVTSPVVTGGSATVGVSPDSSRYSDALADVAAIALSALRGRVVGPVSVQGAPAQSPVSQVSTGSSAQTQVGSAPAGWSSIIIDTDQVDDYFLGTAVRDPLAPSTQAVINSFPTDGGSRYGSAISQLAVLVSKRLKGSSPKEFEAAWAATSDRRMTVILTALAQVGTMYRYTGNQPGGFDCSGLTSYSWAKAGVKIPRTSTDQIQQVRNVSVNDIEVGDLLWRPGHIGMYLGVGEYMVHSPQTGKAVEVKAWGKISRFASPL